jgi:hypothetical protein
MGAGEPADNPNAQRESLPSGEQGGPASGRPPAGRIDPAILEKVLQQTLSAADDAIAVDPIHVQRLRAVAHRRGSQPLMVEPTVVELVRAVLGADFAGLAGDPERFKAMTVEIARALMDDPIASRRLEGMWKRLCDMSKSG